MNAPLPPIDGVGPSYKQLPASGPWTSLFAYLVEAFPYVGAEILRERLARGEIVDEAGRVLAPDAPFRPGARLWYYRALEAETPVPFAERVLYRDEHLLVADKPHWLPVTPAGRFLRETLLVRLRLATGLAQLVPLHRIDRETAGLVLFSTNPASRADYATLFPERRVAKRYEALVRAAPGLEVPASRHSRIVPGEPFYRMREAEGEANAETRITVLERRDGTLRLALEPVTGRKHQLRVHLAALGLPILNDKLYPDVEFADDGDYSRPLQLLAKSLRFTDPLSGAERCFESRLALAGA